MSSLAKRLSIVALVAASFLGGIWFRNQTSSNHSSGSERKPLYYACPMHPGYKSDRPGDAPCCGMRLEPVYATAPAGGIHLTQAQERIAGIRVAPVVRQSARRTLRTTGRVAPDENRLYRINASTEMWVRKIFPPTTGTPVTKDQPLCGFYTTNFLTAAQSFIYILNATDQLTAAGQDSSAQKASNDVQLRQAVELLQNLGVSDTQIREMEKTRTPSALVEVRSPVSGYILSRNLTLGQWLGPGSEMYQIADLSRVWIYADLFENEATAFQPGGPARIWSPTLKLSLHAKISDLPPAFDAATRQARVRIDVENPKRVLWPGMFVDVEIPADIPEGVTVPVDALVYSGAGKVVYVAREDGGFEPRTVETGWSSGDLVQVTRGLEGGESVVVAANFLLDSESRMRKTALAAVAPAPKTGSNTGAKDPICGMDVDPQKAGVLKSERNGVTYYFCSKTCKARFEKDPS